MQIAATFVRGFAGNFYMNSVNAEALLDELLIANEIIPRHT